MLPDHPDHGHAFRPGHLDALADVVEDGGGAGDKQGSPGNAKVVLHVDDEQGAPLGHLEGHDSEGERQRLAGRGDAEQGKREKRERCGAFWMLQE